MPDTSAQTTLQKPTELRVSGHLMTLETGLFCIVNTGGHPSRAGGDGLPGVRISVPPGSDAHNPRVVISGFREDGWLSSGGDAALVRVWDGPAPVLVTIYQGHDPAVPAPNLQVMRLLDTPPLAPARPEPALPPVPAALPPPRSQAVVERPSPAGAPREVAAHVQRRGDVVAPLGEWMGDRGSQRWIEGFAIAPQNGIALEDIEYQAVLGRGWLSPWVEGGQFCGSRGMALPILGLRVRLRGTAAEAFDCRLTASFVDGSEVGPVGNGEPCEADTLAPLEAFLVEFLPRRGARISPVASYRAPIAQPVEPSARKTAPKPRAEPDAPARARSKTTSKPAGRTPPARRR